jgi:hypothetical protein
MTVTRVMNSKTVSDDSDTFFLALLKVISLKKRRRFGGEVYRQVLL